MKENEEYPSPDDLLPHAGPMNLLGQLVQHDSDWTVCTFALGEEHVFCQDGSIPAWFGIECMGQCSHYHYLLNAIDRGEPKINALFLGGRRLSFSVPALEPDVEYRVGASQFGSNERYFSSRCYLQRTGTDEKLVEGRLSALMLEEGQSVSDPL